MFKIFKRKYKQRINLKIAHPEQDIFCPRCGKPLMYRKIGNAVEVRCVSMKCIMGDSRGNYKFQ